MKLLTTVRVNKSQGSMAV